MQIKAIVFLNIFVFLTITPPVFAKDIRDPLTNDIPTSPPKMAKYELEQEFKWLQAEAIIFSATRQEEKVSETAAAAYVITQEDIRRSGVTSIPEALRMVPGVQVAQVNSSIWAISIREFNHRYQNKLLVLIDCQGRSKNVPA
tara:strand:- start:12 stop:440 length:429 start_codon:yes stop_codon:yes gene_type:complete